MFGGPRDPGSTTERPEGDAPAGGRGDASAEWRLPAGPLGDRVARMRRAAVIDMFDQIGLETIPGQVWTFARRYADLGRGIGEFLLALGLDADAVRRRDPVELGRANDLFDLLLGIDDAFDRLAPAIVERIEQRLRSGDYASVRETAGCVRVFGGIAAYGSRWPKGARLAILDAFLTDVSDSLADPLSATAADAAAAERHLDAIVRSMLAFETVAIDHADLVAEFEARRPIDWAGDEADGLRETITDFEVLRDALLNDPGLDLAAVRDLLARLTDLNGALGELLAAIEARATGTASGGHRRAGGGSTGSASRSTLDLAFAFFGFATDLKPTAEEVKKRYRELAKLTHPDLGGTLKQMQDLNMYYDILKTAAA